MRSRSFAAIGILLLLCGGVVLAGSTFGFSTVAADRGMSVSTSDDPSALLGVNAETNAGELRGDDAPQQVAELTNNLDEDVTVTEARVLSIGDGATDDNLLAVASPDTTTSIGASQMETMAVTCNVDESVGEREVLFEASVKGSSVSIEDVTFVSTVNIQCGKGKFTGAANFEITDVERPENAQTIRFDVDALGNKESATIDLTDPVENGGVDYSNADFTVTSGQSVDLFQYDSSTNELTYQAKGNVKGRLEIRVENIQVNSPNGGTVSYSDDQGRTDGDSFSVPTVASNGESIQTDGDAVVPDDENVGIVDAGGDVDIGQNVNVNDGVSAGGSITVDDGANVNEKLDAGGDITVVGDSGSINTDITAGGNVVIGNRIVPSIDAGGDVTIQGGTVNENIDSDGDVYLEDGTSVNGDITAAGTVYVGCNVTLNGGVDAEEGQESTC